VRYGPRAAGAMSRRRRAALLLGLAVVLGGLAASDVNRREVALRDQLAPLVDVPVARRALAAGHRLAATDIALRRIPARFAPGGGPVLPAFLLGRRLAVPVAEGGAVAPPLLERPKAAGAPVLRRGERAAEVVAVAAPGTIGPGARVDVLVTRERSGTQLALQDVEVLASGPAPDDRAATGRVAATLRVTLRQAVELAAAGAFAREIRLLARAPGDRTHVGPLAAAG
jgi:pilus assembly protein CpaB